MGDSSGQVGRYRIIRVLGRGGMGVTYEAEPVDGGRRVAIKELRLSRVDDWKHVDLFEREARVLAHVTHPAVPAYVDHFTVEAAGGPAFYLVQELVVGRSLSELVASGWRADEGELARIGAALLDVLDYLHSRSPPVFHRDIKPQNVLYGDDGKIWLVDFGAVRDLYRTTAAGGSTVVGTYGYMAPEQLRGVAGPPSDLYGLAATLVFVLTARPPSELPQRKLKIELSSVRASRKLRAWLDRMLEPAPEDRFASARQALTALRDPRSVAPPAPRVRLRNVLLGTLLLGTATCGAVAVAVRVASNGSGVHRLTHAGAVPAGLSRLPERPIRNGLPAARAATYVPIGQRCVPAVTYTPDGARLLTGGCDATVKIWDAHTGKPIGALPGHNGRVNAVLVTEDGRTVVTSGDTTVRVWDLASRKPLRTIAADPSAVFGIALSPDGKTIAAGGTAGHASLWTIDGAPLATVSSGTRNVFAVAFAAGGSLLVTAGEDPGMKVWSVPSGRHVGTLEGHAGAVGNIAIAPDGQTLASASDDHTAKLWLVSQGKLLSTLAMHEDEVWTVAFSRDGGTLLTGGKDLAIGVWSVLPAGLLSRLRLDSRVAGTMGLAFAPDGTRFASSHANGNAIVWRRPSVDHATVPVATIGPAAPPGASADARAYAEGMELVDSYQGRSDVLDEAEARFKAILERNASSAPALTGLAWVTFKRSVKSGDDFDQEGMTRAADGAARAIAIDPSWPDAFAVRAWALRDAKDPTGAKVVLATARRLAPTSPRVAMLEGRLATDDGDLDAAQKWFAEMFTRPMTRSLAAVGFSYLQDVYWRIGDAEALDQAHRRELELLPDSPWAKHNYAVFLIEKPDYAAAIALERDALSHHRFTFGESTLASAYCGQGHELLWDRDDVEPARAAFEAAVTEGGGVNGCGSYGLGAYHQYLGVTRHDARQLDEARSAYTRAASMAPPATAAMATRALRAMGD